MELWASNFPSPVMIKSAFLIFSSKFIIFEIISNPLKSLAFKKLINPNPSPPAAPLPEILELSIPINLWTTLLKFIRPKSRFSIISLLAPFCAAYT